MDKLSRGGRQLLDHESLACLLVLLFIDDTRINTVKLHRVIRNICIHGPSRGWIIKALLSILYLRENFCNYFMMNLNSFNSSLTESWYLASAKKLMHQIFSFYNVRSNISWVAATVFFGLECHTEHHLSCCDPFFHFTHCKTGVIFQCCFFFIV